MTDSAALAFLSRRQRGGQALLVEEVLRDNLYSCIWEAEIPRDHRAFITLFDGWRDRLALEDALAAEAGLASHEVVTAALASSAYRELPPLLTANGVTPMSDTPPPAPPYVFHLFVAPSAGRDYQRRLRMAAERRLGMMGAVPRRQITNE